MRNRQMTAGAGKVVKVSREAGDGDDGKTE